MNLSSLPKIKTTSYRRIGRGHGSGRVKTSGRGTKGQKARENIKLAFAGSSLQASWLKRLPLQRGKGKNKSFKVQPTVINVRYLNLFKANDEVTMESLRQVKLIDERTNQVKILGDGELTIALTVKLPVSKGAAKKIEKAGGKVA